MTEEGFELSLLGIANRVAAWFPGHAIASETCINRADSFAAFSGFITIDGTRLIDVWSNTDDAETSFGPANDSEASESLKELETWLKDRVSDAPVSNAKSIA